MQAKLSPLVMGMFSIGSAVRPLVGGAITDSPALTWRFVFWINLREFVPFSRNSHLDFAMAADLEESQHLALSVWLSFGSP